MSQSATNPRLAAAIDARGAGRHAEALQLLAELLAEQPDSAILHYHMAWTYDAQGAEAAAVPAYERAITLGLTGDELRGALLGLGSTYRTLGRYAEAAATLQRGLDSFPDGHEFAAFLAMALYNLGQHAQATELLLRALAETSADPHVQHYRRAILFYASQLDQTWT